MMFLRPLCRSTLLGAASLGVALVAIHVARLPVDIAPRGSEARTLDLGHSGPAAESGQPGTGETEMLSRPLFSPTRRPYVAPVAAPPPEPQAPPLQAEAPPASGGEIRVIGIFLNGGDRQALLVSPRFPEGKWLSVEADVEGWKLARIEADSVQLAGPQGSLNLPLYVDNPLGP